MILEFLKRSRLQFNKDVTSSHLRKYFSSALYESEAAITAAISSSAHGRFIDIGCGEMPYREFALKHIDEYDSLDVEARINGVTYVGDVQNMEMVESNLYDSALCVDVFEHLAEPQKAANEISRILKPGGNLILQVPFLARLHEEPHDYFRYTVYGLEHIFSQAGFEIKTIRPIAGLFSFLGHQASTLFVTFFWPVPLLRWVILALNYLFIVLPCHFLDRLTGNGRLFPLGYICIMTKPGDTG